MKKTFMFGLMLIGATVVLSVSAFAADVQPVPEPATLSLLATGLGAVAMIRSFRKK